jgi:hypothetical protein
LSNTTSVAPDDLDTTQLAQRLREILTSEYLGGRLSSELLACPTVQADSFFDAVVAEIDDERLAEMHASAQLGAVLVVVPDLGVSVAVCSTAIADPAAPIESLRLEVRPRSDSIESFLAFALEPGSAELTQGAEFRGGTRYRYCGRRPRSDTRACAVGWRNDDVDIALVVTGTDPEAVDPVRIEAALTSHLAEVAHDARDGVEPPT